MNPALKEKLQEVREKVETAIDALLPPAGARPEQLHQAMRYSMEAGGKRVRPVLLVLASELFPARHDPMAAAVAVECLHTYTLIHDDLPAVDNSDLRRGRPSCHKQFDEVTAILAGDALLTLAFQLLAHAYADADLACALIRDLADASGSQRLIGGQMEDILNEGRAVEADTLHYIHENKTAALLSAALVMGLRFGEPTKPRIDAMRQVGQDLGLAFQIIDDILDVTSDSMTMGKPVGNDAAAHKSTYVALLGIEGARARAHQHTAAAIEATHRVGGNCEVLIGLIQELGARIH